jgi:hypothetical protein
MTNRDHWWPEREGVQVQLKPLIAGTQPRKDIRVTESASSGLSSEDIDITTVSLASQHSQPPGYLWLPLSTTLCTAEKTAKLVEKHLNAVGREKRRLHPSSDRPFMPFVLSLSRTMESDPRDTLKL